MKIKFRCSQRLNHLQRSLEVNQSLLTTSNWMLLHRAHKQCNYIAKMLTLLSPANCSQSNRNSQDNWKDRKKPLTHSTLPKEVTYLKVEDEIENSTKKPIVTIPSTQANKACFNSIRRLMKTTSLTLAIRCSMGMISRVRLLRLQWEPPILIKRKYKMIKFKKK